MKATTSALTLAVLGAGLIAGVIVLAMWLTGGSDRAAQAQPPPITVGFDMDPYSPETGAQCDNDLDDDGDTNINDGCPIVGAAAEDPSCVNDTDDDGDTLVNDGCPAKGAAETACDDALDDDGDTRVNDGCPAYDPTAAEDGALGDGVPEAGLDCGNLADDDADTLADEGCPDSCGDGIDNNGDGADYADSECVSAPGGAGSESDECANNIDDDGDTKVNDGCPAKGNSCSGIGVDCTLGPIDACVHVPSAGDTITIDVYLKDLPQMPLQPDEGGIIAFQYHIGEKNDTNPGTVSGYIDDTATINLMFREPATLYQPNSDPVGTEIKCFDAAVGDLGAVEYNPPYTQGVLQRLELTIPAGTPDGIYGLTIDEPGTYAGLIIGDAAADDYCDPGSYVYVGCDILDAFDGHGLIAKGDAVPCPSYADLKKEAFAPGKFDLDGDTTYETSYTPGLEIPVSEQIWFEVDETVLNNGPTDDVEGTVTITCTPPESIITADAPGGECSYHVDNLLPTTVTVDGAPLECDQADPATWPGGLILCGDTAGEGCGSYVALPAGECVTSTEVKVVYPQFLDVHKLTPALPISAPEVLPTQHWDVHCYEPSTHVWHFENDIEPVDPTVLDPDDTNNHLEFDLTLDCLAEADVTISSQAFVDPPSEIYPGQDTVVTLSKTLHNIGPYGAVDVDIITTDVTLPTAPPTCTATPDGANPTTANLPVSADVDVAEVWTINCDADATGVTFIFDNSIALTPTLHLSEPDPDVNPNSASTDLIVDVVSELGDVDCSGDWDVVDAGFIFQYVLGLRTEGTQCPLPADTLYLQNADVNGDTVVNIVDAGFVFQCVLFINNDFCPS